MFEKGTSIKIYTILGYDPQKKSYHIKNINTGKSKWVFEAVFNKMVKDIASDANSVVVKK